MENLVFAICTWFCSAIFGAVALWAFKSKSPMHFWSGSTVKREEISDVSAYNRANGWMWAVYALCMFLTGVLSLFALKLSAILLGILCVPGLILLIVVYNHIYRKYRNKSSNSHKE